MWISKGSALIRGGLLLEGRRLLGIYKRYHKYCQSYKKTTSANEIKDFVFKNYYKRFAGAWKLIEKLPDHLNTKEHYQYS